MEYLFILGLFLYPKVETFFSSFLLLKYPSDLLSAEINLFFQTRTSYCSISSLIPNLCKLNLLTFSLIIPLSSFIFVCSPTPVLYNSMSVSQYKGKIHISQWCLHCHTKKASVHLHNQWHQLSVSCCIESMPHFSSTEYCSLSSKNTFTSSLWDKECI